MSKNVLITGGCGFIAHHVIDLLIKKTGKTQAGNMIGTWRQYD